jgi:hypothetical protein
MKNQNMLRNLGWVLAVCFVAALALSACQSTDEHSKSEHPKQEHPAGTNAPPKTP